MRKNLKQGDVASSSQLQRAQSMQVVEKSTCFRKKQSEMLYKCITIYNFAVW